MEVEVETNNCLEVMSATEFNDLLISQVNLLCCNCNKFLWPPIYLGNNGDICGSCYKESNDALLPNKTLELVLQQLNIPCIYSENGCKSRNKLDDMEAHALQCSYRNYSCPMSKLQDCKWLGYYNCFLQHFQQEHPTFLDVKEIDSSEFALNISVNNEKQGLLSFPSGQFLVTLKCDVENKKIAISLFYIGNPEQANNFLFVLQQKGSESTFASHETKKSNVLPITSYGKEDDVLTIDLDLVKTFSASNECTFTIKLVSETEETAPKIDNSLLKYFECPVCNEYMRPPIYQCLSGHSLCHRCRPKLPQCPTCRSGFGSIRNYALEEFSAGIRYPCSYRAQGCMRTFLSADINRHESECPLKPYSCPCAEVSQYPYSCKWLDVCSKLPTHLKEQHLEKTFLTNNRTTSVPFNYDRQYFEYYCLIAFGDVFRVCYKRDSGNQNSYWSIQLVGPKGGAKKYKCEVGLIDERSQYRKLIRTDLCQDLTNYDNMFNQCIMIPTNITSWFSPNNQLNYSVTIYKI